MSPQVERADQMVKAGPWNEPPPTPRDLLRLMDSVIVCGVPAVAVGWLAVRYGPPWDAAGFWQTVATVEATLIAVFLAVAALRFLALLCIDLIDYALTRGPRTHAALIGVQLVAGMMVAGIGGALAVRYAGIAWGPVPSVPNPHPTFLSGARIVRTADQWRHVGMSCLWVVSVVGAGTGLAAAYNAINRLPEAVAAARRAAP